MIELYLSEDKMYIELVIIAQWTVTGWSGVYSEGFVLGLYIIQILSGFLIWFNAKIIRNLKKKTWKNFKKT